MGLMRTQKGTFIPHRQVGGVIYVIEVNADITLGNVKKNDLDRTKTEQRLVL